MGHKFDTKQKTGVLKIFIDLVIRNCEPIHLNDELSDLKTELETTDIIKRK